LPRAEDRLHPRANAGRRRGHNRKAKMERSLKHSESAIRTGFVQDSFAFPIANPGKSGAAMWRPPDPRISAPGPYPFPARPW
jgi:hypothetical protein